MASVLDRLRTTLATRYAIERELGTGGMATVWLAEDLRHHRKVAIKVLREELSATVAGPPSARIATSPVTMGRSECAASA